MRSFLAAAAFLLAGHVQAQATVVDLAYDAVPVVERLSGMPIAILERVDSDPSEFWYRATQALCAKTGDSWCDDQLQILSDTTNQIGWSRVLVYRGDDGLEKKVCVVLPPRHLISPGYVATGLSAGGIYGSSELPDATSTEAWLVMMHAASCASTTGDQRDERRADAFATLSLTLMRGDTAFVPRSDMSMARRFAGFRNQESGRWAVNLGERVLLDLWKEEAVRALTSRGCSASVVPARPRELDTDLSSRDGALPEGQDCTSTPRSPSPYGTVSDENLWIWTSGRYGGANPVVGLPPAPYSPFKSFRSLEDGISYAWASSERIAK